MIKVFSIIHNVNMEHRFTFIITHSLIISSFGGLHNYSYREENNYSDGNFAALEQPRIAVSQWEQFKKGADNFGCQVKHIKQQVTDLHAQTLKNLHGRCYLRKIYYISRFVRRGKIFEILDFFFQDHENTQTKVEYLLLS